MHCHEMVEQAAAPSWGAGYYHGAPVLRSVGDPVERAVRRLAAGSAVVIFSWSSCCMCHAVKRLFCGLGVSPAVYDVDLDPRGKEIERALRRILSNYNYNNNNCDAVPVPVPVPVVFIGGKLIGGMDRVMGSHINGSLVPLLKEAGALWL